MTQIIVLTKNSNESELEFIDSIYTDVRMSYECGRFKDINYKGINLDLECSTEKAKELAISSVDKFFGYSGKTGNKSVTADTMKGLKYDDGKLRLDLIPPETYEALGRVLTYGADKYAPNSWQGVERERYVAALLRHFTAYLKDINSIDEESGLKHIDHVLCNAMFLNYMSNGEEK